MKRFIVAAALLVSAFASAGENLNGIELNGQNLNGVKLNGFTNNGVRMNGQDASGTSAKVAPAATGVRVQNAAARHGTLYVR